MCKAGWIQVLLGLLLLWGGSVGLALARLTSTYLMGFSGLVLAENDDDDDDDRPGPKERELREPEQRQPQVFRALQQELRLGTIWVVQQSNRQQALRVGLEYLGRTIAAITLNPNTGLPVPYEARNTSIPIRPLTELQLRTYLSTLRLQTSSFSFGNYGLPGTTDVRFPVYWNNQLVSYVRFDPTNGQVLPDITAIAEIQASPLKLR